MRQSSSHAYSACSDVNPPVHAWATFRVFKLERKMHGREDIKFLERVFQKLLLNFTWFAHRFHHIAADRHWLIALAVILLGGSTVKISTALASLRVASWAWTTSASSTALKLSLLVVDFVSLTAPHGWLSMPLSCMFFKTAALRPKDCFADGCNLRLNIALELAKHNDVYEDIASKFFEHFIMISDALTFNSGDGQQQSLWNEEDGFYYDAIDWGNGYIRQLPVRSMVGLTPLFATLTLEPGTIKRFPGFKKRMDWFLANRPEISGRTIANMNSKFIIHFMSA